MLKCVGICKKYEVNNSPVLALCDINLHIKKGEFVAIVGHSGSGKSTLMNILGCLDRASEGSFFINGKDVSYLGSTSLSKIRSREIGFIFQSFNLIESLTAFENVCLPLSYKNISLKEQKKRANRALDLVSLSDRYEHLPSELSGGQMQRVAIARALASDPKIILADEPTGNLDPQNSKEVLEILRNLSIEGKTVVIVTHDEKIARAANRIIRITNGKIDLEG